jgi:hypothetical protein
MDKLPLELSEIICNIIDITLLMEISRENSIISNLNEKYIKGYIQKIGGLNGLILNGNLSGVKYFGMKNRDFTKNDNYAIKWAKLCKQKEIVEYLINQGTDPNAKLSIKCEPNIEFDSEGNKSFNFSTKLRPINIDHVNGIKYIHSGEIKFTTEILNDYLKYNGGIDVEMYKEFKARNPKYCPEPRFIRNLNIKRINGENIELVLNSDSHVKIYTWNSSDILKEIIPIRCIEPWGQNFPIFIETIDGKIPLEIYNEFSISFELGFISIDHLYFPTLFKYNSTIPRYDTIPEKCIPPPIETFGKRENGKIFELLSLKYGVININVIQVIGNLDPIWEYKCFIEGHTRSHEIAFYNEKTRDNFEKEIIKYGEMCLPYDIF